MTLKLTYFPVMAKGLATALLLEHSNLEWESNIVVGDGWSELKGSGKCPFGQVPILETEGGFVVAHAVAIALHVGRTSMVFNGASIKDQAISDMLLCSSEDLYSAMQRYYPTVYAALGQPFKANLEQHQKYVKETLPSCMEKLDRLANDEGRFTEAVITPGEVFLFAMLHQISVANTEVLPPKLKKFYDRFLVLPATQKVLTGNSSIGTLKQYFINP